MTQSVVPGLIDALVSQAAAALPNVHVSDGAPVTDATGDFLMVGADSLDQAVNSATATQVPGPFGTGRPRDESGEVNLIAYSSNGDGNQKTARDAVYALSEAVAVMCRANPSLGVSG